MITTISKPVYLSQPGGGEVLVAAGVKLRVGSQQTGGEFELFELSGTGSPSPHLHREHDECFYVINGSFTFTLGSEVFVAQTDSIVFVPRGTTHSFTHTDGARAICFVLPAHLEGYFRQLGEGMKTGKSESEMRSTLAGKYDAWPVR